MLSNKLTCSLASLIFLLMVGLAMPVMAQTVVVPDGTIDPGGFMVIGNAPETDASDGTTSGVTVNALGATADPEIPDLEKFFREGGTVQLVIGVAVDDPDTPTDPTAAAENEATDLDPGDGTRRVTAKDLVISEIMWGLDKGVDADEMADKQWIEIYNTTDFIISIDETADSDEDDNPGDTDDETTNTGDSVTVSLVFTAHTAAGSAAGSATSIISDTVGNLGTGGYFAMPGSSGVSVLTEQVNAPLQSNLVSAYRNIDYTTVRGILKIDGNNNPVPGTAKGSNRYAQLEQFLPTKGADGTLAGSWKATPAAGVGIWHAGISVHPAKSMFWILNSRS